MTPIKKYIKFIYTFQKNNRDKPYKYGYSPKHNTFFIFNIVSKRNLLILDDNSKILSISLFSENIKIAFKYFQTTERYENE